MGWGKVQVYTGNGKGKTTAAIGLAVRAAGAGYKVFFGQFLKPNGFCEHRGLERFEDLITLRCFGRPGFIPDKASEEDIAIARHGLAEAAAAVTGGTYRVVVLDEACVAVSLGLFTDDELLALVEQRNFATELVITGRGASPRLIERSDLVTEMQEIKHYYQAGIEARRGIED